MQQLPGFKSLIALQFICIRISDRSTVLQIESLTFAADTISHLPDQKLKYLALESHMARIERKHERTTIDLEKQMRKTRRRAKKGKGKAKAEESNMTDADESSGSDDSADNADIVNLETRLRFGEEFWEIAEDIKIFRRDIRTGRF